MTKVIKRDVITYLSLIILGLGIFSAGVFAADGYGAEGAGAVEEYALEDMLVYAIQDEYLARAEYDLIMDEYGEQRPFSNIMKAEEYHIELLLPLFEKYEFILPEDSSSEHVILPESIEAALETGVEAEIANIAMYEKFLEKDLPEDVREVFEVLKRGSENHLRAFKNGLNRNNGQGKGYMNN